MKQHRVYITGAAGYVGAMLVDQFSKRDDVERIIALDKESMPEFLSGNSKVLWISANTADGSWQERVRAENPDIVVHTAWQIRMLYGAAETTWKWNVDGSHAVFEFAFLHPSVERLIHFSTASIYGAYRSNTVQHRFTEDEPMREEQYLYGVEKKRVEEILSEFVSKYPQGPKVGVVRPAAITGPRGRFARIRFGLQSALSGQLRGGVYGLISLMVSFVPATPWWVRQFVHEDDVCDIVALLAFDSWQGSRKEIFNLAPPGAPVFAKDMARAVGKRVLLIPVSFIRFAYFIFWHLTRGKVPTSPGVWRFYSYPIVMDGSKIERLYGYRYRLPSLEAFTTTKGRYESVVPLSERSS